MNPGTYERKEKCILLSLPVIHLGNLHFLSAQHAYVCFRIPGFQGEVFPPKDTTEVPLNFRL